MAVNWSNAEVTVIRLKPGVDLKSELIQFTKQNEIRAGVVLAAVGSLSQVYLRLANRETGSHFGGCHEMVNLAGTLSLDGVHLHLSVSDSEGTMVGGHLLDGSLIHTTAEIVIANLESLDFKREQCPESGFQELVIESRAAE